MRYLDPKADLTFKKIFGEHKDLLISLLNALLPLADDEQIESVEYLSPELVPDTYVGKNSIVDVRCRDVKNRQFIVGRTAFHIHRASQVSGSFHKRKENGCAVA